VSHDQVPVIEVDPVVDARWQALQAAPHAGLFHSAPWIGAVADAYGFQPRAYVALDASGAPRGGVAFCEVSEGLGDRLVSLPFSDVCDPLLLEPDAWPPLRARLAAHGVPLTLRSLDPTFLSADPTFMVSKRARWHDVALAHDPADLRRRFGDATRRALAKAERGGLVVRPLEGDEGLAAFVRQHVRLRKRKYRMLAQPPAFFAAIAARFRPLGRWHPLGVYRDGQLLAATIYLHWQDTLYYKFNASDLDHLEWRPNNMLVWGGLQLAHALGCRTLDLGPSDDDQPGLIRFKRDFGAHERELRFLKWAPADAAPDRSATLRRALGDLTQLLTAPEVPDEVTGAAGALLYRFFV
jgi:CelD/BcsL family acetyltransferase involved in cellulose biosynthesis